MNSTKIYSGGVATKIDPPDDRYLPGLRKGLTGVGPRLIETRVAFSLYGTTIPVSFGVRRLAGNILWAKELQESSEVVNGITQYSYSGTFAVSFGTSGNADATQRQLLRVWADGRLVVDNRANGRNIARAFQYRWYDGGETQNPDPTIVANMGVETTPAYRGQMYIVIIGLPLKSFDNKIPAITVEVGDISTSSSFIRTITATGESSNSGSVWVNHALKRAYVYNTSVNPDGVFVYDLDNLSFIRKYSANSAGIPQFGGNKTGIDKNFFYAPWVHKIFGFPDALDPDKTLMVIDPDFGFVEGYLTDLVNPISSIAGTQMQDSLATTVLALASLSSGVDSLTFAGYNSSGLFVGPKLNYPTSTIDSHFFGKSSANDVTYYFEKDGDPDMLSRIVLSYNDLVNENIPVIDNDWLPYDGVAVTDLACGVYCPAFNAILVFYTSGEARLVDVDTATNIWRITGLANVPSSAAEGKAILQNGLQSGNKISYVRSNTVYEIDLLNGTFATYAVTANFIANNSATFNSVNDTVIGIGLADGKLREVSYKYAVGESILVSDLLTQIALKSGYALSDIEVDAAANDLIEGALFTEQTSLREIIEKVRTLFGYEIVESDGKLKIRNTAAAYSTPNFAIVKEDLLGDGSSDAFIDRISVDISIPKAYSITYIDPSIGYQWATQSWRRPRSDSSHSATGTSDIKVPFIMNANLAKKLSAKITYSPWQSQHSYAFSLPKKFLDLEPGDTISATLDTRSYLIKAVSVTYNTDHTISVSGQDFVSFEPFNLEAYSGIDYNPTISDPPAGSMFYLDIPHLNDDDYAAVGQSRFYHVIAPATLTNTFTGVFGHYGTGNPQSISSFSISGTIQYSQLDFSTSTFPVGRLTRHLRVAPRGMRNALDTVGTLNIVPVYGDETLLTSITYDEMMLGGNLAAIGAPGRWEVIRFMDVVLELDGSYTISNIVRGAHSTGHAARDYVLRYGNQATSGSSGVWQVFGDIDFNSLSKTGDHFVLLDPDSYFGALSPIDNTKKLHSYGAGLTPPATPNIVLQRAIDKTPRAPADLRVTRNSDGYLTVSFSPVSMREENIISDATVQVFNPTPDESEYYLISVNIRTGTGAYGLSPPFTFRTVDSVVEFSSPISGARATFSASVANDILLKKDVKPLAGLGINVDPSVSTIGIGQSTHVIVAHTLGNTGRVSHTFTTRLSQDASSISTPVLPPNILATMIAGGATDAALRAVAYDKAIVAVRNLSRNEYLFLTQHTNLLVSPIPSTLTMGFGNVEAVIIEDV